MTRGVPVLPQAARPERHLTPREMEALRWAAEGLSNAQIAAAMGIAASTAAKHIARAVRATGARSRTHAVVISGAWRERDGA